MKNLTILGSTGSIGQNALSIVDRFPDRYAVKALAAKENIDLLATQIDRYRPDVAVVYSRELAAELKKRVSRAVGTEIRFGDDGYLEAAVMDSVDVVIGAMVGAAGLVPTLGAISAGKHIALANKETLVMAGELVMGAARDNNVEILPIDSEHSAIFQCLQGNRSNDVDRLLLTGSGGPFRTLPRDKFPDITVEDALRHPNWQMGRKISIDSSTMMNKGLEIIEARWLFDFSTDRIEVLIHPQSIVHSMVAFVDGSVIAQLGIPDMKGAIAYALSWPDRLSLQQPLPDFAGIGKLEFEAPDPEKFPCLAMAMEAVQIGHTMPAVLNAANEVAVSAFLDRRIPHIHIPETIHRTMKKHSVVENPVLSEILTADRWARAEAEKEIRRLEGGSI